MNTLLASILDCISPVAKSASLVTVAVTRSVATTKFPPPLSPYFQLRSANVLHFSSLHIPCQLHPHHFVFLDREPHVLYV